MAKPSKTKNDGKSVKLTCPSRFGSHKSMLVRDLEDGWVICKDEWGEYKTLKNRLDSGLSDPYRWDRKDIKLEIEQPKPTV